MLNSIIIFICPVLDHKYHFEQRFGPEKDEDEIWYLYQFEYADFDGDVETFTFVQEMLLLGNFGSKKTKCLFKMTLGA